MAKQSLSYVFKNCQISLTDNEITEFGKDDSKVYVLSDIIKKFEGEGKRVDISIKETSELEPEGEF
ncbi:YonK family protein [Priestia flexa]|uniref:YonK family protein n=1 Tax=Priestia flexa TaxID=86664 RepID=UPI000473832B|nr:YonK family protein [Priestia flexa]